MLAERKIFKLLFSLYFKSISEAIIYIYVSASSFHETQIILWKHIAFLSLFEA